MKFAVDVAAREESISEMWSCLEKIDPEFKLSHTEKVSHKTLTPQLQEFCCSQRPYFFEIKKCGEAACEICTPVRMPSEDFYKIKAFPDPVFNKDTGHYKGFTEVYGKETSEDDRP